MSKQNSIKPPTAVQDRTRSTSGRIPRVVQNFLLVWLDANIDVSKEDFKKSLQQLQRIVTSVTTFTDPSQCIQSLKEINDEKIFMIVSGSLGQSVVPQIHDWHQLESVYVFCGNRLFHEIWAKAYPKVKGVYTDIKLICESLLIDRTHCDQSLIPISFQGIDALFMYSLLLTEAFLQIEDNDTESINELAEYCNTLDNIPKDQIEWIRSEYRRYDPIWWYTTDTFMYSLLNRSLYLFDIDILLKMGFFIRHLYRQIQELHCSQQSSRSAKPFQVYRGQGLSVEYFENLKRTREKMMSFNNFLSTTRSRDIALKRFALPKASQSGHVGVLFVMTIDPAACIESSTPFADVKDVGYYGSDEQEILFSANTIFRINQVERLQILGTDRLWQVDLTLVANNNHLLTKLTQHLRAGLKGITGWSRLGRILIEVGKYEKAEQLFHILVNNEPTIVKKAEYNFQLGRVYDKMGEYSKALSFYEKSLELKSKFLESDSIELASLYNNIGLVYENMENYSKALSFYEKDLEISQKTLPSDHFDLAKSYNNIGNVHFNLGQYSKALSFYQKDLEISRKTLPSNHPDLAKTYNNIGNVHEAMCEYSKALTFYEKDLEISIMTLPPNHPDLASSYYNIGNVYENTKNFSKAQRSYQQALDIWQKSLPSNHQNIVRTKQSIEEIENRMK